MKRWVVLALLLSGCGANCGQFSSSNYFCTFPNGVGPDGTAGDCDIGAICLASSLATCNANACCHNFCAIEGCPPDAACVTLTPGQFADGGVPLGCGCVDGGQCSCSAGDGGVCMLPSCLQVCSSET